MGVPVLQLASPPLSIAIMRRTMSCLLGQAPVDDFEIFRLHRHDGRFPKRCVPFLTACATLGVDCPPRSQRVRHVERGGRFSSLDHQKQSWVW
jgi:hypothetical protein